MQDAVLFEKSSSAVLASSQSNGNCIESNCSFKIEVNGSPEHVKNNRNGDVHKGSNDVTQGLSGGQTQSISTAPLMWPGTTVPFVTTVPEESYIQSVSAINNGGMPFQQFPTINSAMYHSGVAFPSSQATSAILSQQNRRAITGYSNVNFPRHQTTLMVNTCSNPKMLPNWNNSHQPSWAPQQPQTSVYPQWNVKQCRSVSNMTAVTSAANIKKPVIQQQLQQQSFISPSKFRRSTSFPGQMQTSLGVKNPYDHTVFDDGGTYQALAVTKNPRNNQPAGQQLLLVSIPALPPCRHFPLHHSKPISPFGVGENHI